MSLISGSDEKIFADSDIGNVRKTQEDNFGIELGTPNGDLFVVCDGMGGHVGGAMASQIAVSSIIEYIDKECYNSPKEALDGALQFANMQILGYANAHLEYKGMGTTACVVLIRDADVWIAHVGDSRIYLYLGKERELHRLTKDHSYVQTLIDAGEITPDEAESHPNKNSIMKALGIKPELKPTFNSCQPKNHDVFLICTDGLCGMISDPTIERILGKEDALKQRGKELIELAMEGEIVKPGGRDNCTLELIEIDKGLVKKSAFHSYNPVKSTPPPKKKHFKIIILAIIAILLAGVFTIGVCHHINTCKERSEVLEVASQNAIRARENLENARKMNQTNMEKVLGKNYEKARMDSLKAVEAYEDCKCKKDN